MFIQTDIDPEVIKNAISILRNDLKRFIVVAGTIYNEKPSLIVAVSENIAQEGINASKMVSELAKEIDGGGGGQPVLASAGGKKPEGIAQAIVKARIMLDAIKI
jgi:alanyl-tRNA synthetase